MATKEEIPYSDVYLQTSRPITDVYSGTAYMMMPAASAPLPGAAAGLARTPSVDGCTASLPSSFGPQRVYRAAQQEHFGPYAAARMPRPYPHPQTMQSPVEAQPTAYSMTPTAATPFTGAPVAPVPNPAMVHAQRHPPDLRSVLISPNTVATSGPLPFDREQVANQPIQHMPFPTPSPSSNGSSSPLGASGATHTPVSALNTMLPQQQQPSLPNCCYGNNMSTADRDSDYSGTSDRATPPVTMARMAQSADLERHSSGAFSPDEDDDDYTGSDNGHAYPLTGRGRKFKSTDEFTRVPGRLSLLGANSKYVVTVGEVRRRLAPPECLNASLLGGVLRKAKAKNGGHDLRKALDEIGLNLPAGRRKATPTTMLTSLVEEEARLLAAQFNDVCSSMFPVAEVANSITQQHAVQASHPYYIEDRQRSIQAAMHVTNELRNVLETYLQQEQEEHFADNELQSPYPPNSHYGLRQFSLITHGFGLPIVNGVLTLFQNFLNVLMKTSSGMAIRDEHALHNAPLPNSSRPRRTH